MADYSNRMRMTGLSGIDTESLVQQLMKAEGMKYDKLKQQRQVLMWKQEAYKGVADKLKSFSSAFLDVSKTTSMRLPSNYANTKATILGSDGKESKAVSANVSGAKIGTYKLEVLSLAEKTVYQSNNRLQIPIEGATTSNLNSLTDGSFDVTVDGKTKTISYTAAEIAAANGADNTEKFENLINSKLRTSFGVDGTATAGPGNTVIEPPSKVKMSITDSKVSFTANAGHELTIKPSTADPNTLADLGLGASSNVFDPTVVTGRSLGLTEGKISINGKNITYDPDSTMADIAKAINDQAPEVSMTFSKSLGSYSIVSQEAGTGGAFTIDAASGDGANFLKSLGFTNGADTAGNPIYGPKTVATDAHFIINGQEFYRSTNTFDYDGLKLTFNEKTNGEVRIDVKKDTTDTFDKIVKFIDAYNTMIADFNTQVSTKRAKSGKYSYYEPLTDEERKAMSDKDIELWEAKAKDGMLYNDDITRAITSEMRTMLYESVDIGDGKKLSLYDIGITTSKNWKDGGKLIIDEKKLAAALDDNPEAITTLFTKGATTPNTGKGVYNTRLKEAGIADRLEMIITNATNSGSRLVTRAGTDAKDTLSDLYKKIDALSTKIDDTLTYLTNKEDYYYSMFSKMEAAINQSNSQMSSLQSMLGL